MKNIIYRIAFLLLLSLFVFARGAAQSTRLLTIDNGLSNSLINHIYQDHYGMLWFSTEDGLNRFDGNKTTIYRSNFRDSLSLKHDYVELVFEDNRHRMFVGHFCGLQRYDYASDRFYDIPLFNRKNERLSTVHVLSMVQRKNGSILVGTSGHGLFQLVEKNGQLRAEACPYNLPIELINFIFEDKRENLWISTHDKGVFHISKRGQTDHFLFEGSLAGASACNFCEDKEGSIYVGMYDRGIYRMKPSERQFSAIAPLAGLPVRYLAMMRNGELYVGTDGEGLKIYDGKTNRVYAENYSISFYDLKRASVHSLLQDKAGNVWVGFYQKGVMAIPSVSNNFQYIGYRSHIRNLIGQNYVTAVYCDRSGTLWVGTDNDGLYKISAQGELLAHYVHSNAPHSIPPTLMSFFEDSDNNLWIGSFTGGLACLNRKDGTCNSFPLLNEYGLPAQRVYDMVEDEQKNLWIATMGDALFRIDGKTKSVKHYNIAEKEANAKASSTLLHNAWITSLAYHKGLLYIGTCDGLACLDTRTDNLLTVFHKSHLFPGLSVNNLHVDKQGTVWIASSSGLIRLAHNLRIKRYTLEDGLPSNVISAIEADEQGNLWLSTNYGISKFNPSSQTFINYYSNDGNNEYAKRASCKSSQGDLYFGGICGVTYFSPQRLTNQKKKPEIYITDFFLNDKSVHQGMKSGAYDIVNAPILEAEELHLASTDNSFSIELSTLDFSNAERVIYEYSMNDNQWLSLRSGTNRISYSKLEPGTYHFKVRAKDGDLYSEVRAFTILISPPWFASVWAKAVYFLLFVGVIAVIAWQMRLRYKARRRMQEHIHAEEINEAKLQFFMNIAHEIRTPMTLVISPLRKLMASDSDEKRQVNYRLMNRNAERIIQLVNQLMDVRKIDKGQMVLIFREIDLVSFVTELVHTFDDLSENKQIALTFDCTLSELPAWIDPQHFDKVILNLLSNAFKFTKPQGHIEVQLSVQGNKAQLIVSDSGVGINEAEIERIFERFYQIRNSQHTASLGTGIGLHLTRSLVELHHGTIRVQNHPDGVGCSFIVEIPLGNAHLHAEEMQVGELSEVEPLERKEPIPLIESEDAPQDNVRAKTRYKVLLVEDDEEIRNYVKQELSSTYTITECCNGKEALAQLLKKLPDLVISDVMMPEMDGLTLCKKIKQNVNINAVPVVLLTAKSSEADNLEGLTLGADAYIVKPFSIEILRKTIANLIKNRETLRNNFSGSQQQEEKLDAVQLSSPDEKLMNRIMKVVNKNLSNTDLNVEMIASEVGVSRVHLYRKLKELTNQTPSDFIRNLRLKQAAKLLAEKHQNVTEVADAVGFVNKAHFSTAFKDLYGVSPTEYMKQQNVEP